MPVTDAATFCSTLVDEWASRGVTQAFVAPGSRSAPLLLALDADERIELHMFLDEGSASFAALGYGNAAGRPGIVLCTSGTAAAHFHAAVIEADLSAIPMIVCTADRPPELWSRAAPQTIDQSHLYGKVVRLFVQPGPADGDNSGWRPLAADLAEHAWGSCGGRPGPVHANLSFRDPLVGSAGPLPLPVEAAATIAAPSSSASDAERIAGLCRGRSGVIVVGQGAGEPTAVHDLAERLGWPVLADHQSGARTPTTIGHFDAVLRNDRFADAARPDVALRFGQPLSSKVLSLWLAACATDGTTVVALHQPGRLIDPEDIATIVVPEVGAAAAITAKLGSEFEPSSIGERWLEADHVARATVAMALTEHPSSEVAVAIRALHAVDSGGIVVAASSMPIRYLEWFDSHPRTGVRVLSNRGANGIDGVIATAIGAALTGAPTVCLVGDVAFLHDSSSLAALARRDIDLTIVVLDNDGGGIFSLLPQADFLDAQAFDRLFGTPHGTDLVAVAAAHGLDATDNTEDLTPRGVRVVVARCADRTTNAKTIRRINDTVANSLP